MATFNDSDVGTSTGGTTPSYGIQKTSAPFTRVTRFADGYEQRVVLVYLNIKILKFTI